VRESLERLQERFPLGILGEYEILCTGRQLFAYDDDPASGYASGVRQPGWIALSWRVQGDLDDLLAHELTHALAAHLSAAEPEAFWHLIGQEPGDWADARWERRPQERLAEYLSAALFSTPIDERVLAGADPDPTPGVLAQIREWATPILGRAGMARVTIGDEPLIVLTIGSPVAFVEGRQVTLDVPPQIVDGRTLVPLRFVSQALGRRVDWEPKDGPVQRVLVY